MLWNENPMILIWYSHLSCLTRTFVAMTKSLHVWGCVNKLPHSVYSSVRTRRNAMPLHAKSVSWQCYMWHYITHMHKKYKQFESILTSGPSNKFSVCRTTWNHLIQLGQQTLRTGASENRWMVAPGYDEWLTTWCGLTFGYVLQVQVATWFALVQVKSGRERSMPCGASEEWRDK
jgi:hypothetical protein